MFERPNILTFFFCIIFYFAFNIWWRSSKMRLSKIAELHMKIAQNFRYYFSQRARYWFPKSHLLIPCVIFIFHKASLFWLFTFQTRWRWWSLCKFWVFGIEYRAGSWIPAVSITTITLLLHRNQTHRPIFRAIHSWIFFIHTYILYNWFLFSFRILGKYLAFH